MLFLITYHQYRYNSHIIAIHPSYYLHSHEISCFKTKSLEGKKSNGFLTIVITHMYTNMLDFLFFLFWEFYFLPFLVLSGGCRE